MFQNIPGGVERDLPLRIAAYSILTGLVDSFRGNGFPTYWQGNRCLCCEL